MMADSMKVLDDERANRIHSHKSTGHLHKGHGVVAANSSIPTKYQTIVTDNSDKKGFLAKAKRFQTDGDMTETPGPGNYLKHGKVDNSSASFSKKGTGGFASKSKRVTSFVMSNAPGPGIYLLPSQLQSKSDFNNANTTSVFHKPIAQIKAKSNGIPAPNAYEVLRCKFGKANNVTADAAFKSKTRREILNTKEASQGPAPCHYSINDHLIHDSPVILESSFKSTSKRWFPPQPPDFPGPGTYLPAIPEDPAKRLLFPRKHYLCISAPAMPLPPAPPMPGPGSYEVVDFDGPSKHYMSGSAFVSATSRWSGHASAMASGLPGPAHYKPIAVGKQSFMYNSTGRWI